MHMQSGDRGHAPSLHGAENRGGVGSRACTASVDAHQHFWRLERGDYAWLTPDLEPLYRDFEPEHLEPLLRAAGVERSIVVQAAPTLAETRFLLALAEATPFIAGVVGWVDLAAPEACEELTKLAQDPALVGVRPMLQDIEPPDWMLRDRLRAGDMVSVYPVFEALDISPVVRLRPAPLREIRFILDGHLGKLARALRLLGFDSLWDRDADDPQIIDTALGERRIILTRDRELLKSGRVTHGYWVRSTDPREQLTEILDRLDLRDAVRPFTRCTVCNGAVEPTDLETARAEAPERVREWCTAYYRCGSCNQLYWKGTHFERLEAFVDWALG